MSAATPRSRLALLGAGLVACATVGWLGLRALSRPTPPSAGAPGNSAPAAPRAPDAATTALPAGLADSLTDDLRAALLALAGAATRGDARDREAVLTFKDDAALRRFLARTAAAGVTITGRLDGLRTVRVQFDSFEALARALGPLAGDLAAVGANALVGFPLLPAKENRAAVDQVPFGNDTLAFLGARGDRSAWGRGTTIAILDSGVAPDATFGSSRLRTLDIGLGTAPGTGVNDGHGTGVAALAAGAAPDAPGVAPGADLLSIRVTDATGVSDLFTISRAIVAAVDAGARVVNISLGGYATGPVLDAAIAYATSRGVLLVAAAGNDQAARLAWPAADPRVLSVGAVDKAEQQVSFSNSGAQLQLTAPGYGVQTAWLDGARVYVDGTSASAPLVAGAVAAVLSQNPALTPAQAAALLVATANDTGAPGADPAYGRGILNLGTALNASDSAYVDTAVAAHHYDAAAGQMRFTVQNRSGRTVSGLTLGITAGTVTAPARPVPSLAPGETYVASVPVDAAALAAAGSLRFATVLANPLGTVDAVPANNTRSSVLAAPVPGPP